MNRNTWREKFSSSFRTRKQPLGAAVAGGVVRAWERAVELGAELYWEALPYWDEDIVDREPCVSDHRVSRRQPHPSA